MSRRNNIVLLAKAIVTLAIKDSKNAEIFNDYSTSYTIEAIFNPTSPVQLNLLKSNPRENSILLMKPVTIEFLKKPNLEMLYQEKSLLNHENIHRIVSNLHEISSDTKSLVK